MNISPTAYNPFAAAAQAAIAELVSDRAQQFYTFQAQKDIQNALDNTLTVIGWVYELSEMVYYLGALSRAWCDQMVADSEHQPTPSSRLLCPAAAPVALLPAGQPPTIRLPGSLASSGVAIVTPAPATDAPVPMAVIEVVSPESGAETIAPAGQKKTLTKPSQPRSGATGKRKGAAPAKTQRSRKSSA